MVMGDAAQLQQVLMNLVGNARQAIQQHGRGGWICVRTRQTPERRVQLNVEDDGPGVPQSILARIFDPFFTTKAAGVGTGLGLSIVLSIVREARRTRERTSRTGRWRSFFHRTAGGGRPSRHAGGAPESPRGGIRSRERRRHRGLGDNHRRGCHAQFSRRPGARAKVRVLVVEDEPTVARLIADVLHDEGFVVDVLLDGREALERVAEETFDLVICDMKMPGLDGQHFFQSLAESGNPLQHSFLFVTGDVIAPARQAFLERSGLPHLAKPFRMEELTARVHQVLDDSTPAGSRQSAVRNVWRTGKQREKVNEVRMRGQSILPVSEDAARRVLRDAAPDVILLEERAPATADVAMQTRRTRRSRRRQNSPPWR